MIKVNVLKITNFTKKEYEKFRELISEEKCLRIARFKFLEDYQRALLADVLSRKMIERMTGIEAQKLDIRIGPYGKPYIFNSSGIEFNVSHSGEYVACIVSDKPCGIDIEKIDRWDLSMAKRFFTENEYRYIVNGTDEQKVVRFYEIWTAKEAYAKFIGRGLGIGLDSFEVISRNGKFVIEIEGEMGYRVNVKDIGNQYKLSFICMENDKEQCEFSEIVDLNCL